jgi:hypothetical protein
MPHSGIAKIFFSRTRSAMISPMTSSLRASLVTGASTFCSNLRSRASLRRSSAGVPFSENVFCQRQKRPD